MTIPPEAPRAGADFIQRFLSTSAFVGHLGIQLREMQPDMAQLVLPFSDALVNIGSTVHGGAIASLIDTAAAVAAWSNADVPEKPRGVTVGLTVTYMAAASQEDLLAVARTLSRGRSLVYLDVAVSGASSGVAVAKGLVTYKIG